MKNTNKPRLSHTQAEKLSEVLGVLAALVAFSLYGFRTSSPLFYAVMSLSAALAVACIVIKMVFFRCPHCRKTLPFRTFITLEYCPRCGNGLESAEE